MPAQVEITLTGDEASASDLVALAEEEENADNDDVYWVSCV